MNDPIVVLTIASASLTYMILACALMLKEKPKNIYLRVLVTLYGGPIYWYILIDRARQLRRRDYIATLLRAGITGIR